MSGSDARKFASAPGVLLIGRLEAPYYAHGEDQHQATLDEPTDQRTSVDGAVLTLSEIWYYDVTSGRVFYRQHIGAY